MVRHAKVDKVSMTGSAATAKLIQHGGRGHAHPEHLRARRQVAEHRVRRCRPRRRRLRRDHPVGVHVQRRPSLRGRLAHPDPAPGARRDARAHPGHRRVHRHRRPARPGHRDGSADLQGAVRQGRRLPRDRAARRPTSSSVVDTDPRWSRPARGPLGRADPVPLRRQLDPDLSRRDLRAGRRRASPSTPRPRPWPSPTTAATAWPPGSGPAISGARSGWCATSRSGNVWVNSYMQIRSELPFGGIKESGYGHDTILDYTREKTAVIAVTPVARPHRGITRAHAAIGLRALGQLASGT